MLDSDRLMQLRGISAREAGAAQFEADRQRALAQAATDPETKLGHERGARSYDELAAQHAEVAEMRQAQAVAAAGQEAAAAVKADEAQRAELAGQQTIGAEAEAARLGRERQAEAERLREEQIRTRTAELEAELERARPAIERARRHGYGR